MSSLGAEIEPIRTTAAVASGDLRVDGGVATIDRVVVLDLIIDGLLLGSGTREVQAR